MSNSIDLQRYLHTRLPFQFESFNFGSDLIASLEGSSATIRGSDSLSNVKHAISTGRDQIPAEVQNQAYLKLKASDEEKPVAEKSGFFDYMPDMSKVLPTTVNWSGFATNMSFSILAILIIVVGLVALIFSTDTGKAVVKDAAKLAAV